MGVGALHTSQRSRITTNKFTRNGRCTSHSQRQTRLRRVQAQGLQKTSGRALRPAELHGHTEDMAQQASPRRIGSFLAGQCTLTSRAKGQKKKGSGHVPIVAAAVMGEVAVQSGSALFLLRHSRLQRCSCLEAGDEAQEHIWWWIGQGGGLHGFPRHQV